MNDIDLKTKLAREFYFERMYDEKSLDAIGTECMTAFTLTNGVEEVGCMGVEELGEFRFKNFKGVEIGVESDHIADFGIVFAYFETLSAFNRHWLKLDALKIPIVVLIEETKTRIDLNPNTDILSGKRGEAIK